MIDKSEFMRAWEHLCARFGREADAGQAAAYFSFLSDQMDTAEFLQSARALWATAKWFPRPADFLLLQVSSEWGVVLAAIRECNPPEWKWAEHYQMLTQRGKDAAQSLGGIHGMKSIHDKDVLRLKTAWEAAFEQATADLVLTLPSPATKRLAPVG